MLKTPEPLRRIGRRAGAAAALLVLLATLSACAEWGGIAGWASETADIQVSELGRSLNCMTKDTKPHVRLLDGADAVRAWEAARGVRLGVDPQLDDQPYALVEQGRRPGGGYSLAVSRDAQLHAGVVTLQTTFIRPPSNQAPSGTSTSPCVLVSLPSGRYRGVRVLNQDGVLQASTTGAGK